MKLKRILNFNSKASLSAKKALDTFEKFENIQSSWIAQITHFDLKDNFNYQLKSQNNYDDYHNVFVEIENRFNPSIRKDYVQTLNKFSVQKADLEESLSLFEIAIENLKESYGSDILEIINVNDESLGVDALLELKALYSNYLEIKSESKGVQILAKRIYLIRRILTGAIRDLKRIFTLNHSFHFKNLDDYHSLSLIRTELV